MGMSASQARLLSITSRLTNNEFRSQTITNSKLRLASESEFASQKYMDALEQKQLMFMCYDDDGAATKTPLTACYLSKYEPLKNQYVLRNAAGKMLVSSEDAANFEQSKDLVSFLKAYDLVYDVSDEVYDNYTKPAYDERYNELVNLYNKDLENYKNTLSQYNTNLQYYNEVTLKAYNSRKDAANQKHAAWEAEYAAWEASKADGTLYDKFINSVGDSRNENSDGVHYCYYHALNNDDAGCYLHLLNYIIGFEDGNLKQTACNTSTNVDFTTNGLSGGMSSGVTDEIKNNFIAISKGLNDATKVCDGADSFVPSYNSSKEEDELSGNIIQAAIDDNRKPSDLEILMSDYKYDATNNKCGGVKTLKQKAMDLYYIIQNSNQFPELTAEMRKEMLINFTEGDMKKIADPPVEPPVFNEPEPQPPVKPNISEPTKPTYDPPEQSEVYMCLKDKEKSQWYINLWFGMNGSDTANVVTNINFDSEGTPWYGVSEDTKSTYRYSVSNAEKNTLKTNYEVYEDNLFTSSEWLQFALEHGMVSMEQAKYFNPGEDSEKIPQLTAEAYTWNSIVYTSAADIISQDNEKAIAIAEVQYKKEITEIENKDKKYDQDLKKLDTEHNALQTEYESIRDAINKNVERSFKAFS